MNHGVINRVGLKEGLENIYNCNMTFHGAKLLHECVRAGLDEG